MKKKLFVLILAVLLLLPITQPASADSSGICFVALNDKLEDLGSAAVFVSGSAYVPAKVFSFFGVYYNYFASDTTATLYNASKQVYFNLSNGNSYDGNENLLSTSAVFNNNQVYVPASWVCNYFGLSYSYITGTGNGDVARIKNGLEILTDSEFLNGATFLMKTRYTEYFGKSDPPAPTPTPTPTPEEEKNQGGILAFGFIGMPGDRLLKALDDYGLKASFFVTAQEAEGAPDTLRRIYGSGHNLGVYCVSDPAGEFEAAAEVIFDAVQLRPTLLSSPSAAANSVRTYAEENGCAFVKPGVEISESAKNASSVLSIVEEMKGFTAFAVPVTQQSEGFMPYVFSYAATKKLNILQLRETRG